MSNKPDHGGPLGVRGLVSVNFHINQECNAKCRFCFAQFEDVSGRLALPDALAVISALRVAGAEKITFVGGEPTLHPDLGVLLRHAKALGLATCVVTNGARAQALLSQQGDALDWLGLSVDSAQEEVEQRLGRGRSGHVARAVALASLAHRLGIRVKLNTVVTALNWQEDMGELVRAVCPARWKVFQVLAVQGQNDGGVEPLLISAEQFHAFCSRHAHLAAEGLGPVVEDNTAMTGSYVMVDPLGRFFSNASGAHTYSAPILEVGVATALEQIAVFDDRFRERGAVYDWVASRGGTALAAHAAPGVAMPGQHVVPPAGEGNRPRIGLESLGDDTVE